MSEHVFEVKKEKILLADLVHLAKKICDQQKIEYDPYKIIVDCDGKNVLMWIESKQI